MTDPTRILVAGDWHGNGAWGYSVVRRLPRLLREETPRLILHCGDFGIWPGPRGKQYLDKLDRQLKHAGAVLWFVDGNHEDFTQLSALPSVDGKGWVRDRIWHLPRGHRWTWHGRTWVAVGGGVSLDRAARTEGVDWWPEEEITDEQETALRSSGTADVMVSHDRPSSVIHTFPGRPSWWAQADVDRSERHEARLQRITDAIQPAHLIHGHLHRSYARTVAMSHGDVQVTGLDCDGAPSGNWAVLDVKTMEWSEAHA